MESEINNDEIHKNISTQTNDSEQIDEDLIFNNIIRKRLNHTMWFAFIELYKIICTNGGLIFGGAIRDYIKRTNSAKKFYEYLNSNETYKRECFKDNNTIIKYYNDNTIHTYTYDDRTLLPNDIDVYVQEDNYKKIIKKITKDYYIYCKSSKNKCYFLETNDLFRNALEYKRHYVSFLKPRGNKLCKNLVGDFGDMLNIKVEFIILKNLYKDHYEAVDGGILYPPFGNPDFDVNQLGMTMIDSNIEIKVLNSLLRYDINSSNSGKDLFNPLNIIETKLKILQEVINNINNGIAIPLFPDVNQISKVFGNEFKPQLNYIRANKIYERDYIINGEKTLLKFEHIKCASEDYIYNDEDKCIICFDLFTSEKKWFQFGCDCNIKMHLECYAKYIRKPAINEYNQIQCPYCRSPIKYICPCKMMNFISSINHCLKTLEGSTKQCVKCINNDIADQCTKWYHNCSICDV